MTEFHCSANLCTLLPHSFSLALNGPYCRRLNASLMMRPTVESVSAKVHRESCYDGVDCDEAMEKKLTSVSGSEVCITLKVEDVFTRPQLFFDDFSQK